MICKLILVVRKDSLQGCGVDSGGLETPSPRQRRWDQMKMMQTKTWTISEVHLFPYAKWMFIPIIMCKILHWLQIASATTCLFLSLMKLIKYDYGEVANDKMVMSLSFSSDKTVKSL